MDAGLIEKEDLIICNPHHPQCGPCHALQVSQDTLKCRNVKLKDRKIGKEAVVNYSYVIKKNYFPILAKNLKFYLFS